MIQQGGGVQFDLVLTVSDFECILTEEYCIVDHLSIKKVLSYLHFESVSPKIALNCVSFSFKILTK